MDKASLLEVRNLTKLYRSGRRRPPVRAVDGVSFTLAPNETLALVGESGSGKTTAARCVLRALTPTAGEILYRDGEGRVVDLARLGRGALRPLRRDMQMIFQDPFASLNPRMTVGEIIGEPLYLAGVTDGAERARRVRDMLDVVRLPQAYHNRFPHAFSGGQRQRIGIARALVLRPRLVVADEPVSALDVSVQAQVLNLLLDLQDRFGLTMLFVGHDLSVVKHVADRVAVMYCGRIVEVAPNARLFGTPRHPYTRALLEAVPSADPRRRRIRRPLPGDVPDPSAPPPGCPFHPRCVHAVERCRREHAPLRRPADMPQRGGPDHEVACHRAEEIATVADAEG